MLTTAVYRCISPGMTRSASQARFPQARIVRNSLTACERGGVDMLLAAADDFRTDVTQPCDLNDVDGVARHNSAKSAVRAGLL